MAFGLNRIVRLGLLTLVATGAMSIPSDSTTMAETADATTEQHVRLSPEVRLRKLHLVRPDLIPYPIAYEICC